jgi:hypothetical protein
MQSNTVINICIAKSFFYMASLTTTCFGRYIGHHHVVQSLIFKANYTIYGVCQRDLADKKNRCILYSLL